MDANAVAGALISSGIGKEATNVVAAPATVPAKTIRASLFSDTLSNQPNKSPPRSVNKKNHFGINQVHIFVSVFLDKRLVTTGKQQQKFKSTDPLIPIFSFS